LKPTQANTTNTSKHYQPANYQTLPTYTSNQHYQPTNQHHYSEYLLLITALTNIIIISIIIIMSMNYGASLGLEPGSWQEAIYDIIVGTIVGGAHIFYFVKRWYQELIARPLMRLGTAILCRRRTTTTTTTTTAEESASALLDQQGNSNSNTTTTSNNNSNNNNKGELKVVGAGFGRTGTVRTYVRTKETNMPERTILIKVVVFLFVCLFVHHPWFTFCVFCSQRPTTLIDDFFVAGLSRTLSLYYNHFPPYYIISIP
jgi:hypothetical protein